MIEINEVLNDNFKIGKDTILQAIADKEYRYKRHGIKYSIAAVYTECGKSLCDIEKYLRKTDQIIKISPVCFCICFDVTDTAGAIKVSQNVINNFLKIDSSKKIYIGVTTAGNDDSNYDIVTRAFYTLNEAKKHNYSSVEDDSVLDHLI